MMQPLTVSPVEKQELEGVAIFKALLERQKLISDHIANGGTFKELRQMGIQFGKVDLRNDASARH